MTKGEPISPDVLDGFMRSYEGNSVAIALSGGPDSMALCWLLSQWAARNGGPDIHALTVDHGLRPDAHEEAAKVAGWVGGWPHVTHTIMNRDMTGMGKTRIMEEARHDRYALLASYCHTHRIGALFVAHHRDDQAETFLFRLAKGSGLDGLSAMRPLQPYNEEIKIVRPLLGYPKDDLLATCAAHDVPFVRDPSNDDTMFARVRLRKSAAILAEEGLSSKRLSVTAARLARAREALDFYAAEVMREGVVDTNSDRIEFNYGMLLEAPEEMRLRVLQMAMELMYMADRGGYGPRMEKLEGLVQRLFAETPFKRETLAGFMFSRDDTRKRLILEKEHSPEETA
ncbi:MAG: tRNA lysidine(34) synthetase TilS [Rhodospirillales bacterium]|nr:tRNA lysidine(34) synthetase TilS [Rhodospirillales bacterium]